MFSKTFFTLAVFAVAVAAQGTTTTTTSAANATTTALAGVSPCILGCVEPAATANGCSFTDASCVCASAQFQADATACLKEHCTPADLTAAQALQTSQCATANVSVSGTATTTHSVAFSTIASNSTTTGTGTGTGATTTGTKPASGTTTSPTTTKTSAANGIAANVAFMGAAVAGLLAL